MPESLVQQKDVACLCSIFCLINGKSKDVSQKFICSVTCWCLDLLQGTSQKESKKCCKISLLCFALFILVLQILSTGEDVSP